MKYTQVDRLLQFATDSKNSNKISRRDFLHYATLAGLSLTSASSLWSEKVEAQTPKRGGILRLGMHDGNSTDSHDPATYTSDGHIQLAHTHRSFLTEITSENGLGPDMADSWEASPDAKVWTFNLNKDAVFQSGRKFTSKDAIASLNIHRGKDTASAAAALLADVVEIKSDGDHTIIIELTQGFADLPWILADYHLAMVPANSDGTPDWQSGDGAGPYQIVNFEPGISTSLVRHEGWHREGAWFDEVQYSIINDANARQTALLTNSLDVISSVDFKTLSLLEKAPNIKVDNVPSGSAVTLPMHCDVAPYDNVDVRLALKYAINREDVIDRILYGSGSLGNDFHISSNMPYYPEIEQRTYDPDKAKFHLKKAGVENLNIDLSATNSVFSGAVDMCVLYGEHAKATGINMNVVREPADGYWANVWLKKPFVFVKWGARPTPDNIFSLAYKDTAPWNESHWKHPRFNELLLQAKAELNESLRAEMYQEMCQLARDDGGSVIPVFVNFVYARRDNVQHGPSLASSWELDGARATSRWWFA